MNPIKKVAGAVKNAVVNYYQKRKKIQQNWYKANRTPGQNKKNYYGNASDFDY